MNDITLHVEYTLHRRGGVLDLDVIALNRQLQRTLHNHTGRYARPLDLIAERIGNGRT